MNDVIMPTTAEVIGWIVIALGALAFITYAWIKGKQEENRTVTWIRDWED